VPAIAIQIAVRLVAIVRRTVPVVVKINLNYMDQKMIFVAVLALVVGGGVGVWFDRSFNRETPSGQELMTTHMTDMAATLKAKTGDDLDQAFLEEMIVHHEGAIAMSKEILDRSSNSELKSFARSIIDAQSAEIKKMSGWLDQLFGSKG